MSEQAWYVLAGLVVALLLLTVIFRRGKVKGSIEAFGVKAGVEGSGPEPPAPAAPPPAPGVSASGGGIAVGRDAKGTFSTGGDGRAGRRKR